MAEVTEVSCLSNKAGESEKWIGNWKEKNNLTCYAFHLCHKRLTPSSTCWFNLIENQGNIPHQQRGDREIEIL